MTRSSYSGLAGALIVACAVGCIALTGVGDFKVDDQGVDSGVIDTGKADNGPVDTGPTCKTGEKVCAGKCLDVRSDPANCGDCGKKCTGTDKCSDGACTANCTGGTTLCPDGKCYDLRVTPLHCGSCTKSCFSDEECIDSLCVPACSAPTKRCGTKCIDITTDHDNCGDCAKACATDEECKGSTCAKICAAPKTDCAGTCTDLMTDGSHCGTCATDCGVGTPCVGGACTTTVTFPSTGSSSCYATGSCSALGAGGSCAHFVLGDYLQESFARNTPVSRLDVSFKMSDCTSGCASGISHKWAVKVNGVTVGSHAWTTGSPTGDKTIATTFSFAAISPVGGKITLRYEALDTICSGGGSWNWYAGGTATMK